MRQYFRLQFGRPCAALIALLVIASAISAQAVNEFDPGIGVGIELTKKARLDFFSGREKSDDIGSAKWKISGGLSFRFKPLLTTLFDDDADSDKSHVLVVGAFYEFSRASDPSGQVLEHRATVDGTARRRFESRLLLTDRNRVEFRWVNGEFRFRYRNRPSIERPIRFGHYRITPYGAVEAFFDAHVGKWNQFRFTGGSLFPVYKLMSLDAYYERAHCSSCSNTDTNVFGVTVNIFFKRKK